MTKPGSWMKDKAGTPKRIKPYVPEPHMYQRPLKNNPELKALLEELEKN